MRRFAIVALLLGCGSTEATTPVNTPDQGIVGDSSTTLNDTSSVGADGEAVDTTVPPSDTATGDTPDTAIVFGPYPAGPYGNKVGDTLQNLVWEGYVNVLADAISNTKPYVASVDMDKLRRDAKKGYALVHVSEFF